jgi:biotin transport system substrate-specific component
MIATSRLVRVPPFERGITLGDYLVPIRLGEAISSRARHVILVALGTLIIVAGARVSIPIPGTPVPVTLQTFGVLFTAAMLGTRRGMLSVLIYLLLGVVGAPVFAYSAAEGDFSSGADTILRIADGVLVLGSTGGYLVGFVLAAVLVGRLAELGWDRHFGGSVAAMALGNVVIYVVGVPWLAAAAHLDLGRAFQLGAVPFLFGDLLKLAIAAGLLPLGWWVVRRRTGDR